MGPKPSTPKNNNDLFRQRLDELVNPRHPLAQLAQHIDWSAFERQWAGLFPSSRGRPATAPRLVAGLLYLQHTFALSDEDVVWGWVENPYWQLFCGEIWFQHNPPIDPSSLTRWRQRIGKEGIEWLLAQTIRAAASAKVIKRQSLNKVIVDSTVQEKAIAYPTDSKLLNRGREQLVKLVAEAGMTLRQNYNRVAPKLAGKIARHAHARQYQRMRSHLKKLKTLAPIIQAPEHLNCRLAAQGGAPAQAAAQRQPQALQPAGQSLRWAYLARCATAGGNPDTAPTEGSVRGPGLPRSHSPGWSQGLPPQTQTRHQCAA